MNGPIGEPSPPPDYPGPDKLTEPSDIARLAEEMRRLNQMHDEPAPSRDEYPFGILYTRSMLEHIPPPETIFGPYIISGGVNMLYGKWGSAKSFLMLSWAAHLATGVPWNGHQREPENVLFWAAEGQGGLHGRLTAWEAHHGTRIEDSAFIVPQKSPSLDRDTSYEALAEVVERTKARHLFIDTLIRVKGSLRENEADELGGYLLSELAHRICVEYGCSVTLAHHVGHEAKDRPRGSSSIADNLDALYEIRDGGAGIKTLHVRKLKDQPMDTPPDNFRLVPVADSAVLVPTEDIPLTDAGRDVVAALEDAADTGDGWISQTRLVDLSGRSKNLVRDTLRPLLGTLVDKRTRPGKSTEYRLIQGNPQPSLEVSKIPNVHPSDDLPDPW
jgi:hypothetical protein